MFSEFRMGPTASRHGLYDIVRVFFRVNKTSVKKKWEILPRRKYANNFCILIGIFVSVYFRCA